MTTSSSSAGHETPEERTALEAAFTDLTRASSPTSDPLANRITEAIKNRRARRAGTNTEENQ